MMDWFLLTSLDGALTAPLAAVRRRIDRALLGSDPRPPHGECS
jgi:hypothetical protein